MPSPLSIHRTLLFRLLVPLLGISVAGGAFALWVVTWVSAVIFDRQLSWEATDFRQEFEEEAEDVSVLNGLLMDRMGKHLNKSPDISFDVNGHVSFNVIDQAGQLVGGSPNLPPPSESDAGISPRSEVQIYDALVRGKKVRIASVRAHLEGAQDRFFRLQVSKPLEMRAELTEQLIAATVPQGVFVSSALALAILYGVRRGIKPLSAFDQALSARPESDPEPLSIDAVPLETRHLARSINRLLERVRGAAAAQQQCAADAAHLMQTPLAGMKAQIQLGRRCDISDDTHRIFDRLEREVDRVSHALRELMLLFRNDRAVSQNIALAPVDLHGLVVEATVKWVPVALQKDIDLGCSSCSSGAVIEGDADRLLSLIDSLLENAIRYTQPGGTVTIGCDPEHPTTLRVVDNGPGIPIHERSQVFDRFYRGQTGDTDGSGLGLAIVKEIAELHGATVDIQAGPGDVGTEVTVAFPPSPTTPAADASPAT